MDEPREPRRRSGIVAGVRLLLLPSVASSRSRRERGRDEQTEPPVSNNRDRVPFLDDPLLHHAQRRCERLGERSRLVRQRARNSVEVGDRQRDELGERAVAADDAEDRSLGIVVPRGDSLLFLERGERCQPWGLQLMSATTRAPSQDEEGR